MNDARNTPEVIEVEPEGVTPGAELARRASQAGASVETPPGPSAGAPDAPTRPAIPPPADPDSASDGLPSRIAPASTPAPSGAVPEAVNRVRVVRDGFVYLAAIAAITYLRHSDNLDVGTGLLIALVAGVRPQMVAEILASRIAPRGAPLLVAGISLESALRILRAH